MANRYNPPQKRPAQSTANYFTPLTLTSNTNTGVGANAGASASASRVNVSTAFPPIPTREQGPTMNIHAPYTHPSSGPHTTLHPQTQASPLSFSGLTMHSPSHLRGDSSPYMPIQAPSMTSPSITTPTQPSTTLPHQALRPRTAGIPNMLVAQPTWPTPSPRFQNPLPPQPTPSSTHARSSTQKQPKPSVKHLTCFFWSEFGHCQWSSTECLYAHWFTGKVASAPVQVEVGKPAVAGRNAEAAKPRYEAWRAGEEKASVIEGGTPMSSASSPNYSAPALLPFPPPPTAMPRGTGGTPEPPVALLVDAVTTLSAALHRQQTRVGGMKGALVEYCQAMLDLAQAMDARGLPIEEFVERSMVFVESVAEHGREAEELGALLGRVRARLEGAGLRGVVRAE